MGLLPKDLSPRFFNPLISIHKEYYIHILLTMESILSDARQIALPRSAMMRELHRQLERENWREDLSDEEDFGANQNETDDTAAYTVRKFVESGWIDSDESGDRASDMVFITLYGKKLTDFIRNLLQLEDQSGHVVNTYSNLQQVRLMPENGYTCVKNAYESTQRLLTSLEMMYSKIKSYYTLVLENQRPETLLQAHLNGYVHDVVDKVLFPLKVDDSVDRFKGPILAASADLLSDTPFLNTVVQYAVQSRKEAAEEDARAVLFKMLHFIHSRFDNIEAVIRQLDDRNNLYLRVTRQKLQYMLTMDTSLKGNIISLLKRSKEESDDFWQELERQLGELNAKIQEIRAHGTDRLNALQQRGAGWHRQLDGLREAKTFLSLDWPAAERESDFFWQQRRLDLDSFANFHAACFQEHVTALNRLMEGIRRQKNLWEEEHGRLLGEQQEAEERLRQLEAGKKQYMPDLLRLRAFLQKELSTQFGHPVSVDILADLIDIRNQRWTNVIEGYLSRQKFYLFVDPDCYRAAVRLFKKYSRENACYRYNIVNTHSIRQEHPDVYPNSLAGIIVTDNPFARTYIDYLLGRVECVEKIEEVDGRRTAVTDDGMLYKSYSTARMEEKLWRLHFIGQNSIPQQIEATQQRLAELRGALQTLGKRLRVLEPVLREADDNSFNSDFLENLAKAAGDLRNVPELDRKADELAEKLNLLDTSFEDSLREQKNTSAKRLQKIRRELTDCATHLGALEQSIRQAEGKIQMLRPRFKEKADAFENFYRNEQEFTQTLSLRYEKELSQKGKAEKLRQDFLPAKAQTEQALNVLSHTFRGQVQKYNSAHQEASINDDIASDEWKTAYDAVQKVEVAQFQEKVSQARDRAEEIFQNEFINQIKRNIDNVRLEIGSLNKTLTEYTFGRVQYRFKCEPTENAELRKYYDLIMNANLDGFSLYTFMQRDTQKEYEPLLKTLFQLISSEGTDAADRRQIEENIEKYKSFQTYLKFDLVEVDAEGTEHPLSRSMDSKSGGERQTPFYIAILASLMKTYRMNQKENSLRLVVFDEAFDKIDTSRIEECVLMLKQIGFQSIVVAPTDRAAYIAPLVERTWVVTKPDDQTSVLSSYRKDLSQ